MINARPEGTMPEESQERKDAPVRGGGDVPLLAGSTPAPRKLKKDPCKGCTKRKLFCHSFCPEYIALCAEEEERKKAERLSKTFTLSENGKRAIWRSMRGKK